MLGKSREQKKEKKLKEMIHNAIFLGRRTDR